jgi:lysophospholipid hydrolase
MDAEVLAESVDRHPLVSLVAACFWVIRAFSDVQCRLVVNRDVVWLLSWTKSLVAFATITIPRSIYAVLSYSMTLTVRRLLLSLVDHSSRYFVF